MISDTHGYVFSMRRYNQLTENIEKQIVQNYNSGKSSLAISKKFNIHPSTVLSIVRRWGYPVRTTKLTSKKYKFNEDFFENIDTEEKAYWLGFILADGCLSRGKDLIIALKRSDENHLKKFINSLKGNNQLQYVKNNGGFNGIDAVRLSIRSKKIIEDLSKHGLSERKSMTSRIPTGIPLNLINHFWRGVVDGDGHICINNQPPYKYLEIGLCGSKNIVEEFSSFIHQKLGIRPKVCPDHSIWKTKTGCSNAVKLCSLLYDNSTIYLDRKILTYKTYDKKHINNS